MIKKLLKSVREYKTASIIVPVLMAVEAIMEIVIPFLMTFIVGELGAKLAAKASCGFAHNLREDMYNNLQTFSFANIDNYSTASLITRITTDVTNVQNAYQMAIRMLIRAPILFIASIIMTCFIEPLMALMFAGAAIVLGIVVSVCMFKVTPYFRTMFKKYDTLNAVVQEDLTAIRVVKSYVREDTEIAKMKKATGDVYTYSVKAERILTIMMPSVMLVMFIVNIFVLTLGSNMSMGYISGAVDPTEMQTLFQYSAQILSGVMMVAMCLNFIALSRGSAERIVEVLDEKTTLPKSKEQIKEVKDGSIDFDGVEFCYSQKADVAVLKDIDLHIKSGETIGVIGGTGAGKSTLVNLICRLYDVDEGSVCVGGVDVRKYDTEVLRNQVSVVLQKNTLFSGTILDNLRWGNPDATEEECIEACKAACADEFIARLPGGYHAMIQRGGSNVSGGQKQRLCIARALLKKPKVLILDDSTSAVDTATDASIRAAFAREIPGTTKIIIAQRISSVQSADRILVLDNGKVDAFDTHERLLETNAIYQEIYTSQLEGSGDFDQPA